MEHKHNSIEFYFEVSSILLHLFFLKTELNWLNSNFIGSITSEKGMVHAVNTEPSISKGNFIQNGKFS